MIRKWFAVLSPGYFPSVSRIRDSCHADSTGRLGNSNGADASFLADEVGAQADEDARGKDGAGDAEADEEDAAAATDDDEAGVEDFLASAIFTWMSLRETC